MNSIYICFYQSQYVKVRHYNYFLGICGYSSKSTDINPKQRYMREKYTMPVQRRNPGSYICCQQWFYVVHVSNVQRITTMALHFGGPQDWLSNTACGNESTLMTMEWQRWPVNEWTSSALRKAVHHWSLTSHHLQSSETLTLKGLEFGLGSLDWDPINNRIQWVPPHQPLLLISQKRTKLGSFTGCLFGPIIIIKWA